MVIVGIQRITSKKTGDVYAKVHLLEDIPKEQGIGQASLTEFIPFTSDIYSLCGVEVKINYRKGFGGQAIVDSIEPLNQ